MPTTQKLDWQTVDTSSLKGAIGKAFGVYTAAMEAVKASPQQIAANEARKAFEELATSEMLKGDKVPAGKVPQFGYKWGKLSIAWADATAAKKAGAKFSF